MNSAHRCYVSVYLVIQLASLNVEEFDLRLDEGMVRWAQGLADRVMWTLVADRRADEMDKWPLPHEAFCSSQVQQPDLVFFCCQTPHGERWSTRKPVCCLSFSGVTPADVCTG